MHFTAFVRDTWAAGFVNNVLLLLVLLVRRRSRYFPAVTVYVVFSIVSSIFAYWVFFYLPFSAYRTSYLVTSLIDEALQLFVVYELAVHVFCPTGTWAKDVRRTFIGLAAASAVVAACLSWIAQPATRLPIQTLGLRTDFFSALIMSELFVGMLVLSATAGLPWKTHVARIAQGWGTYSIVCVAADIVLNVIGSVHETHLYLYGHDIHVFVTLSHLKKLTYLSCQVYWIVMLWLEAPAQRELPEVMRNQIYSLQRQVEYDLMKVRVWRKS